MKKKVMLGTVLLAFCLLLTSCVSAPYIGENGNWWQGDEDLGIAAQGPQGVQGVQGEQGIQGEVGPQGKSTYEMYCEVYGYTGTEEEWVAEIHRDLSRMEPTEIYELAKTAVVTVETFDGDGDDIGSGTGFFIDDKGTVVTAYHIIDGAQEIKVRMLEDATYPVSKVVAFDKDRDLAILKINVTKRTAYLELEKESLTAGEAVYSFGSSLGILDGSFSSGVVASNLRETVINEKTDETFEEIQYTAPVSNGNSGSPLINAYGRVVGVVTWGYTIGSSLNFGTYIKELDHLNRAYERSVKAFFLDTQYYQDKMYEMILEERENNDATTRANHILSGQTMTGETMLEAIDIFEFVIHEESDFNMAYYADSYNLYYPALYDAKLEYIDLTWEDVYDDYGDEVCCARTTLSPGTYYIVVEGRYEYTTTEYWLYTYWRPQKERNNFKYEITFEDMFR